MKAKAKKMTVAQIQKRMDKVRWSAYTQPAQKTLERYCKLIASPCLWRRRWKDYGNTEACALCRSYAPWYERGGVPWVVENRKLCKRHCPLGHLNRRPVLTARCTTAAYDALRYAIQKGTPEAIKCAARARLFEIAPLLLSSPKSIT